MNKIKNHKIYVGDISVADHTMIAAGAVLNKSTEENSIYGGRSCKDDKKTSDAMRYCIGQECLLM